MPMLVLWALAALFVGVYYILPGGAALFTPLMAWQTQQGYAAAFLNRVLFLGALPGCFLFSCRSIRPPRPLLTVLAYSLWGGAWGIFDDALFTALTRWFGAGTDFATLLVKTLVGQLIGTVLVGLVPSVLFFRWVAADFSVSRLRAEWPAHFFGGACLTLLLANWIVWIPVNVCTYAFPLPLQIQLVGLAGSFWMLVGLRVGRVFSNASPILLVLVTLLPSAASALTLRTKADLRLWETVTDRARPLAWSWETNAVSAELTFSNRLTHAVSSLHVAREAGALRGTCEHPVPGEVGEGLVAATLVQSADGGEVARSTAELAYASGVSGSALTVRTKAARDWWRVPSPRVAAFDADWWGVAGSSGYEILWATPAGRHVVVRTFEGVGDVDAVTLRFGTVGFRVVVH